MTLVFIAHDIEPETVSEATPAKDREDTRPQQFRMTEAWLHVERERVMGLALDWRPTHSRDIRDSRSAQLLGETLLRMRSSHGSMSSLSICQDLLELKGLSEPL